MASKVLLFLLAAVLVAGIAPGARVERAHAAGPFVVNSTGDATDAVAGDGICETATSGECTLRAAIQEASAAGGGTINFAIGSGTQTIAPASMLPAITQPITIDATTQPGWSGLPLINLDGSGAWAALGLYIPVGGAGSAIRGLAIYNFAGGIEVGRADHVTIDGNIIGTDAASTLGIGNLGSGVLLYNADQNTVGGPLGNVISGNSVSGIAIVGDGGHLAALNVVQNNRIGTNISGTAPLGNGAEGVFVQEGDQNEILLNVISGNHDGVRIARKSNASVSNRNHVLGNFIGTDASGTGSIGNAEYGIDVASGMNSIGDPHRTLGEPCIGACNVISGNGIGVWVHGPATGALIVGNVIGADVNAVQPLPNGTGIALGGLLIDGQTSYQSSVEGNDIAFNSGTGVVVDPLSAGNGIIWNAIRSNGALGIDLGNDGVTLNDHLDGDVGANDLQNFPAVGLAYAGDNLLLQGSLDSSAGALFTVSFYSSRSCDPAGYGEGETFLGSTSVTTNAGGKASYSYPLHVDVPAGDSITATATDTDGNTSEFSACRPVTSIAPACSGDTDCDGYADSAEVVLGTDPTTYCGIMRADVNGDGAANIIDLALVASQFFQDIPPGDPRYDQNGDGHINILDLARQAAVFDQSVSACP